MNLLIEQRPATISSSKSQSESSPISNENDMNNSSSTPSSLVLKIKRHTTKQPKGTEPISSSSSMVEEEEEEEIGDNHSRSTVSLQRSKRPNSNTATRRPSSPAFYGKQQQTTKRSVPIDNNNNDLHSHIDDISATKRFKSNHCNSSSSKVDASVETVSIGLATEPDHLGPCEPGTSVVLEGIVWNETDSGVLVVNVTWRGKTYVGTLLDSTKQDWACPRLTCESPTSDYDPRSSSSSSSKTSRTKRTSAGGTNRSSHHQQSLSSFQQITSIILSSGMDDRKLRHNIKSRQSKRLNNLPSTITDELTTSLSPLTSPYRTNQTFFPPEISTSTSTSTSTTQSTSNLEPQLIPCSEFNCHKRFTSNIGLSYHLSNAHHKSDIVSQANTRDEEDVAHILANVAHYARRPSPPPPSVRFSPGQAVSSASTAQSPPSSRTSLQTSALTWPCPQISSKLVQSSSLNNNERMISPNSTRCQVNNADIYSASNILDNQTAPDQDDLQTSVKPTDHSIFRVQDESHSSSPSMNYPESLWNTTKKDQHNNKKRPKLPTPPPTIPATSSSPAYSDISDEDPTTTGPISHEQMLPPSTINLLTATNEKLDENGNNVSSTSFLSSNGGVTHADIPNPAWTAQMLFQKFSPFISQPTLVQPPTPIASSSTKKKTRSTTPNGLNSKTHCPPTNGTSDSTVKNILDARRSSTIKPSSSPPINLYHYHPNGTGNDTKFSPSVINTLTSPNENLLHPSPTPTANTTGTLKPMDILDYSLSHNHSTCNGQYPHSSSLHPSR